jgi:ABC-type sugar transport system ATPase subunit
MLLQLQGITKKFPGVIALNSVNIDFIRGEIHAIVGENGAGKSTLIKVIGGKYQPDSGDVLFKGKPVRIPTPHKALEMGISTVYQEYNLIPDLRVIENIMLGREPFGKLKRIDWRQAADFCRKLMSRMGVEVDLHQYVSELGAAEAKIVEILKALVTEAEVVIMDEPTAALPEHDVDSLFSLIKSLKKNDVTVIYISHRIDEIFSVADRVSVLKDGDMVGTYHVREISSDNLIKSMVGRELQDIYSTREREVSRKVVLSVRDLQDGYRLKGVSFNLHEGEIIGIGGMTGNGQRELIRALFGAHRITHGEIAIYGEAVSLNSPQKAMKLGIGFLPDDRRNEGIAITQPVRRNISLPSLHLRQNAGMIRSREERKVVEEMVDRLGIKVISILQKVETLSGGNQQRVVLAKWLPLSPKVLLFHEPTLGIDVGAKVEIYRLINVFVESGVSIIMVTSDMIELLHVPDRILVFYDGFVSREFSRKDATEEAVMFAASGSREEHGV